MKYRPTYIEVKAVRLIGGKIEESIVKLNETMAKCEMNKEMNDKVYTSSRRLYRLAVTIARKEGWKL